MKFEITTHVATLHGVVLPPPTYQVAVQEFYADGSAYYKLIGIDFLFKTDAIRFASHYKEHTNTEEITL